MEQLQDKEKRVIGEIMKTLREMLPEVTWDRYTISMVTDDDDDWQIDDDSWFFNIYGWVPNRTHGRDFVLVFVWASDAGEQRYIGFNTSSAKYSAAFAKRLGFTECQHNECHKVPGEVKA